LKVGVFSKNSKDPKGPFKNAENSWNPNEINDKEYDNKPSER
jgi:hypothetical protein